ncbi:MAG: DUF2867 domain-containing protein [Xanthomonadales bacterium]|nr:DUF2867 domain-containing protein [Xanthomonadales bacterium]
MSMPAHEVLSAQIRSDSLLCAHLRDADHQDAVELHVEVPALTADDAQRLMGWLLQGFVDEPSGLVSSLMRLRNGLVRPLGLRRARLGCPVSSLLGPANGPCFGGRFPVLDQRIDLDGGMIEVVLGADDKHLRFRSCVGVLSPAEGRLVFSLETRVETLNAFGRFYMRAIRHVHHRLIAPLMLRRAADYALRRLSGAASAAA